MAKIKIALLAGGLSAEREVSLKTGRKIAAALDRKKYDIFHYDPKTTLMPFIREARRKKFDLVFPALHGPYGEDGRLQGLLDMLGVNYLFSGTLASAAAMHKGFARLIASQAGLAVAPGIIVTAASQNELNKFASRHHFPLVVKPVELGSSVGITIAPDKKSLDQAIRNALKFGREALIEKFITGRELTVSVIGRGRHVRALPVIEIIPKISAWFDYRAKYEPGGSLEVCPAEIPVPVRKKVQGLAIKIYEAIGARDLARADFIWAKGKDGLVFLEINTIPGMTATSLAPQAARAAGYEFGDFLDLLIENALASKS